MENRQTYDLALQQLRNKLLQMGESAQEAIQRSLTALREADLELAAKTRDADRNINHMEHTVEDLCIRLIATQQPVASDLRKIVAGMRIASDLERIGDFAVDIAKTVIRMEGKKPFRSLEALSQMAETVDSMISGALTAYVENNLTLAQKLAADDDKVDKIYRHIVEDLFASAAQFPEFTSQAVYIAFVGRYLERCGDHATNIGESVIYIISGERSDLN